MKLSRMTHLRSSYQSTNRVGQAKTSIYPSRNPSDLRFLSFSVTIRFHRVILFALLSPTRGRCGRNLSVMTLQIGDARLESSDSQSRVKASFLSEIVPIPTQSTNADEFGHTNGEIHRRRSNKVKIRPSKSSSRFSPSLGSR